jgi:hypothetical protein
MTRHESILKTENRNTNLESLVVEDAESILVLVQETKSKISIRI